jgi:hypothetical protein
VAVGTRLVGFSPACADRLAVCGAKDTEGLLMPWTEEQLPFAESASPMAAQCSFLGAQDAARRASTQTLTYLELLAKVGPLTDAEAAKRMGVERTSINARRKPLCDRGVVVAKGRKRNRKSGIPNTLWGLAG